MQEEENKYIKVSFWKALAIVAGAILVSVVGTAFTIANTGVSDHFLLVRAVERIDELEENVIPKDEILIRLDVLNERIRVNNELIKEHIVTNGGK